MNNYSKMDISQSFCNGIPPFNLINPGIHMSQMSTSLVKTNINPYLIKLKLYLLSLLSLYLPVRSARTARPLLSLLVHPSLLQLYLYQNTNIKIIP